MDQYYNPTKKKFVMICKLGEAIFNKNTTKTIKQTLKPSHFNVFGKYMLILNLMPVTCFKKKLGQEHVYHLHHLFCKLCLNVWGLRKPVAGVSNVKCCSIVFP